MHSSGLLVWFMKLFGFFTIDAPVSGHPLRALRPQLALADYGNDCRMAVSSNGFVKAAVSRAVSL